VAFSEAPLRLSPAAQAVLAREARHDAETSQAPRDAPKRRCQSAVRRVPHQMLNRGMRGRRASPGISGKWLMSTVEPACVGSACARRASDAAQRAAHHVSRESYGSGWSRCSPVHSIADSRAEARAASGVMPVGQNGSSGVSTPYSRHVATSALYLATPRGVSDPGNAPVPLRAAPIRSIVSLRYLSTATAGARRALPHGVAVPRPRLQGDLGLRAGRCMAQAGLDEVACHRSTLPE
jgi:hypothetical protein